MSGIKDLVEGLASVKEELRLANKRAKDLKGEHDEAEQLLIQELKAMGLDRVSAAGFTASYSQEIVANATDWEEFYRYIKENDAFYLLQKRISSNAFREVMQIEGVAPPGTEPVEKDKLSFTKR